MLSLFSNSRRLVRWFFLVAALVLVAATSLSPVSGQSGNPAATIRLSFPNSPVSAILPYYEKLTGARIIQDANLAGVNLSINSEEPLTRSEAISFIESVFLLNGFAFLPVDDDTLKLVNFAAGKSPRSQGLPVIASPTELPPTDAVVNYVMQLDNITPDEAVRTFSQVVSLNPYGAITPLSNANGVVITENTSTIRSLIDLKSHVDVPPAQVANQLIKLHRADAEKIAELIGGVFEQQTGAAPVVSASGQAGPPMPGNPGSPGASDDGGGQRPPVMIIPYRRTNSLMIIARPVDLRYIESLVSAFDQPSDGTNFLKQTLRYVSVSEYLPVFYNALARGTDIENDTDRLLDAADLGGNSGGGQLAATGGYNGGGMGGDHITAPDRLSEPEDKGVPRSYVVGNTLLISDPQANTLIASGSPEDLEVIQKLIDEIDIEPRQVYISTIIGQMALGDEFEYSLSALQELDAFKVNEDGEDEILGAGVFNNGNRDRPLDVQALDDIANFDVAKGLSLYGQFAYGDMHSVSAMLRLFARDQRFRLLSRPSVYAQNNVKAVISSGQRIAVPVSTLTSVNNGINSEYPGSVASNIEYRDVVLKLEVIPLINSDDKVTLKIAQMNDNIIGSQFISGNEVPTLSTQELITTITVRNGETIVLGGLITEREEEDVTGLPVIRRIPVIGRIFGGTEKSLRREELLIFIQPHIIPGGPIDSGDLTTNDLERGRTPDLLLESMEFADPKLDPSAESERASGILPRPYQGPRGSNPDR